MPESGHVEVWVRLAGEDVAAGDLWMHRAGRSESATFAYRTGYLSLPQAYELDPELPLQTGQFQTPVGRAVFGAFADTAPDRWGRRLIQRAEAVTAREEQRTARAFAERDYLLEARDDMRQGALRYREAFATSFGGDDTGSLAPLVERAEFFRLDTDAVADTLALLIAAIDEWETVAVRRGLSSAATAQMAPAFETAAREEVRDLLGRRPT